LAGTSAGHVISQFAVAESADVEFTSYDDTEEVEVVAVKQVETAVASVVSAGGARDFSKSLIPLVGASMAEMNAG